MVAGYNSLDGATRQTLEIRFRRKGIIRFSPRQTLISSAGQVKVSFKVISMNEIDIFLPPQLPQLEVRYLYCSGGYRVCISGTLSASCNLTTGFF